MKSFFKKPEIRYAFAAVGISLLFGIFTNLLPQKISQKDPLYGYGSDSEVYWDLSGNILSKHAYLHSPGFDFSYLQKTDDFVHGTQRLPGYPLILSFIRLITGAAHPNSFGIILFNIILVFLNAYFILGILKKLFQEIPEKYYLAVCFFPSFLIYSNGINSDFFTLVLLSGFCFFVLKEGLLKYLALLFGAMAIFTRGNALFFVVPFWLLYAFFERKNRKHLIVGIIGIFFVALIFVGWSWRNHALSSHFTFAPFTGLQLRQNYIYKIYKYSDTEGEEKFFRWRSADYLKSHFNELVLKGNGNLYYAEAALDREITKDTVKMLWQKKIQGLRIYIRNVLQMSTNEYFIFNAARSLNVSWVWVLAWVAAILFFTLPALLFFGISIVWLFKHRLNLGAIIFYSALFYYLLTAAVLGDFARYLVPIGGILCISVMYVFKEIGKVDFKQLNWYNRFK